MMKTKITLTLIALIIGFNTSFGQDDNAEQCANNLSIFSTQAKNKKYDEAYPTWMKVRNECSPRYNRNVYVAGEKILKHKIKNSTGAEQLAFVKDMITIYEAHNANFASKFPKGKMYAKIGNLTYDHREALGATPQQIYDIFDKGYTQDLENFDDYRALYIYFKMAVKLYDAGTMTAQQLFDKYDDVNDKIEIEVNESSKGLNELIAKEESGTKLTSREGLFKKRYGQLLGAFDQITKGVEADLGERATCKVLIPLYQKDFEQFKNDAKWLQRAINKMGQKDCTDDPLFEKLVEQKNRVEPDADVAYYLGVLKDKKGQKAEAEKYYRQSLDLQTDPLKKWKLVFRLAEQNRKKGSLSKARQLYREALQLNPSDGLPYLRIARMYASSANNCGTDVFSKRAVYWAAANEARKAGRVDGRLKKTASGTAASYIAKAPDKSMIFSKGMKSGDAVKIGCWIGVTVRIP